MTNGAKYTYKIIPYVKVGGSYCLSTEYNTDYVYTLKKINSLKISTKCGKVRLTWTKINGASGYEIAKLSKKKGKYITVKTYRTTKAYKSISAIKKKGYYYRLRVYKTVKGKRVYAPWSNNKYYKRK